MPAAAASLRVTVAIQVTRQVIFRSDTSQPPSFLCLSQESSRRASARRKDSFSPRTWAGWISVTSTEMRGGGLLGQASRPCDAGPGRLFPDKVLHALIPLHMLDFIMIRDMFCEI
ncbi:hypothetical protein D0C28_20630 [Rhizobium sp. AU243]|nr:hypothetical protein D0C28_20630 [Rhizobium sp. AU243]